MMQKRTAVARKIGNAKLASGLPIVDATREAEVLQYRTRQAERMGLDPVLVRRVFVSLMAMTKKEQKKFK